MPTATVHQSGPCSLAAKLGLGLGLWLTLLAMTSLAQSSVAPASSNSAAITPLALESASLLRIEGIVSHPSVSTPLTIELPNNAGQFAVATTLIPALGVQVEGNPELQSAVAALRRAAIGPEKKPPRRKTSGDETAQRTQGNASWLLGLLYLHGIGVPLNPTEAAAWFERANALNEPLAPAGLAWCAIDGCRKQPDPAGARRWLIPLRAANLPRAQYFQWLIDARLAPLQMATSDPKAGPGLQNASRLPARQLLLSAAQRGDVQANIELGFDSLAADRTSQAIAYFQAAAARSEVAAANAELLTSRSRPTGKIGPQALIGGDDEAATTLERARRNHRGEGQSANFVEAIRLYRLAQSQGSVAARKMLELIFSRPGLGGQIDITWMQQLALVDVSRNTPGLFSAGTTKTLQREPTPLFDLLPPFWRANAGARVATSTR